MATPRILIAYSNPHSTERIRLDLEHRAIEEALKNAQVNADYVRRLHATTVGDLISAVSGHDLDIVQFSGHGSPEGIYLEGEGHAAGELLDFVALQEIIRLSPPSLRAVILTCCFSGEAREALAPKVPYLISVDGPAPDKAAIEFSRVFYSSLLSDKQQNIERAYDIAKFGAGRSSLKVCLTRRGLLRRPGDLKIEATLRKQEQSLVIDLTPVRDRIQELKLDEEEFLDSICTGIRAHRGIFNEPMDRVALIFDQYVGIFSWKSSIDPIMCEDFILIADEVTEAEFEAVVMLMTRYTVLASQRYRFKFEQEYPGKSKLLHGALEEFEETRERFFIGSYAESLRKLAPNRYKVAAGLIAANLSEADGMWARDEFPRCIAHLEAALTTMHSFIRELIKQIRQK